MELDELHIRMAGFGISGAKPSGSASRNIN
jgi:hypothetical protein